MQHKSEDSIITHHLEFVDQLCELYQAQPPTNSILQRLNFVADLTTKFPLWVDGAVLWVKMPEFPEETKSETFVSFERDVIAPLVDIYEQLNKLNNASISNIIGIVNEITTLFYLDINFCDALKLLNTIIK